MKKIGDYTIRGSLVDDTVKRLLLDDGKFNTGYVVESFLLYPERPNVANSEVYGCLATIPGTATSDWNAGLNTQIGWSSTRTDGAFGVAAPFQALDPDNLIIQDLYLYANDGTGSATAVINYLIKLVKYEFPEARGALAMVRNNSQGY